ncbi:MAG: hypothetical protein EAX96_11665 [Candidatus Lokiarchaeota archaeon]|nr:hypothetical protein [Candidatus Lokiarchaeota archaeon]
MEKLISWLKGGNNLKKMITKVQVFSRELKYQSRDMEKKVKEQYKLAKRAKKEGNDTLARKYIESRVRYQKWHAALESYRMNIDGLIVQLNTANNYNTMAKHLGKMAGVLNGLQKTIQLPKLNQSMRGIQNSLNQFDIIGELIEEGIDEAFVNTEVKTSEIEDGLAELDAEIGVETGHSLKRPASGKVSKLEDEIRKLKGKE